MGREQQRCRGDGLHRPVSQVIGLNDSLTGPAQTLPRRHTSITVTPHTHTTPPLSTGLPHGSRSSRDARGHTSIHPQTELITFAAGLQPAMGSSNPSNPYHHQDHDESALQQLQQPPLQLLLLYFDYYNFQPQSYQCARLLGASGATGDVHSAWHPTSHPTTGCACLTRSQQRG